MFQAIGFSLFFIDFCLCFVRYRRFLIRDGIRIELKDLLMFFFLDCLTNRYQSHRIKEIFSFSRFSSIFMLVIYAILLFLNPYTPSSVYGLMCVKAAPFSYKYSSLSSKHGMFM